MAKKDNLYFMGIDPSLTGCAYSILKSTENIPVKSGVINNPQTNANANLSKMFRLRKIRNIIYKLLKEYNPKVLCIEGYSYGSKNGLLYQAEVYCAIMFALLKFENKPIILNPAPVTVKLYATNNSGAKKDLMLLKVFKNFGIEYDNHNEADAFVISHIARCIYHLETEFPGLFTNFVKGFKIPVKSTERAFERLYKLGYTKYQLERVLGINKVKSKLKFK